LNVEDQKIIDEIFKMNDGLPVYPFSKANQAIHYIRQIKFLSKYYQKNYTKRQKDRKKWKFSSSIKTKYTIINEYIKNDKENLRIPKSSELLEILKKNHVPETGLHIGLNRTLHK